MTETQAADLDLTLQFLFRDTQDEGSYWTQFAGFLVNKGRLPDLNIIPEIREYWDMAIYQTMLDGYIVLKGFPTNIPINSLKRTFKGREFFNDVPDAWRGKPYSYAFHHPHHH